MTARTHDLAAISALGALIVLYPLGTDISLATVIAAILANQIGGIAPDIDQPTAPLWHNLPEGRFFGKIFGKTMGGHRFLTHSLLGVVIFGILTRGLLIFIHPLMPHINIVIVWWAFIVGMLSHLIMDTITKEGVPWLLPLPVKIGFPPTKAFRITTGKSMEKLLFISLLGIDIWYCAANYSHLLIVFRQIITN